jgi:hypothetical protein
MCQTRVGVAQRPGARQPLNTQHSGPVGSMRSRTSRETHLFPVLTRKHSACQSPSTAQGFPAIARNSLCHQHLQTPSRSHLSPPPTRQHRSVCLRFIHWHRPHAPKCNIPRAPCYPPEFWATLPAIKAFQCEHGFTSMHGRPSLEKPHASFRCTRSF